MLYSTHLNKGLQRSTRSMGGLEEGKQIPGRCTSIEKKGRVLGSSGGFICFPASSLLSFCFRLQPQGSGSLRSCPARVKAIYCLSLAIGLTSTTLPSDFSRTWVGHYCGTTCDQHFWLRTKIDEVVSTRAGSVKIMIAGSCVVG